MNEALWLSLDLSELITKRSIAACLGWFPPTPYNIVLIICYYLITFLKALCALTSVLLQFTLVKLRFYSCLTKTSY